MPPTSPHPQPQPLSNVGALTSSSYLPLRFHCHLEIARAVPLHGLFHTFSLKNLTHCSLIREVSLAKKLQETVLKLRDAELEAKQCRIAYKALGSRPSRETVQVLTDRAHELETQLAAKEVVIKNLEVSNEALHASSHLCIEVKIECFAV